MNLDWQGDWLAAEKKFPMTSRNKQISDLISISPTFNLTILNVLFLCIYWSLSISLYPFIILLLPHLSSILSPFSLCFLTLYPLLVFLSWCLLLSLAYFGVCTHPIQTAQILNLVFISPRLVVDDSMLLIHTARLQTKGNKHETLASGNSC